VKARKKNYRPSYDHDIIKKFREENPNVINDMRMNFSHMYPYACDETIEQHIDNELLPPVLETPEQVAKTSEDVIPLSVVKHLDREDMTQILEFDSEELQEKEEILQAIEYIVEAMDTEDKQIFKMFRGMYPYTKRHVLREIAEETKVPLSTIGYRINKITEFLKILFEKLEEKKQEYDYCE